MADDSSSDDPNDSLPLSDLERWVSPSTLEWLDEGDREKAAIQAEIDEDEAGCVRALYIYVVRMISDYMLIYY